MRGGDKAANNEADSVPFEFDQNMSICGENVWVVEAESNPPRRFPMFSRPSLKES